MTLVVEENYVFGVPQTTVAGWSPAGVAWHWSAGGRGRAGWEATIRHLIATRYEVNASYHGGLWGEHAASHVGCRTIIQWIVPTTKAAHSMAPSQAFVVNPTKDRARQDERFREVRRILGATATDPNAGCLAIAYAGMPADLEADLACRVFRADVQDVARQLVGHPAVIDRPHFGHGWIQPVNRYEMDVAVLDFIALLYAATPDAIPTPRPEDIDVSRYLKGATPIINRRATVGAGGTVRSTPYFDPRDYDANRLFGIGDRGSSAPIVAWVEGTNLTLASGEVFDGRKRWAAIQGASYGLAFVHERDVVAVTPIEASDATAIAAANGRTEALRQDAIEHLEGIRAAASGAVDRAIADLRAP